MRIRNQFLLTKLAFSSAKSSNVEKKLQTDPVEWLAKRNFKKKIIVLCIYQVSAFKIRQFLH